MDEAAAREPAAPDAQAAELLAEAAAEAAAAEASGEPALEDGPAAGTRAKPPAQGGPLAQAVAALRSRLEAAVQAEEAEQRRQRQATYKRSLARRLQDDGLALLSLQATQQGRSARPRRAVPRCARLPQQGVVGSLGCLAHAHAVPCPLPPPAAGCTASLCGSLRCPTAPRCPTTASSAGTR